MCCYLLLLIHHRENASHVWSQIVLLDGDLMVTVRTYLVRIHPQTYDEYCTLDYRMVLNWLYSFISTWRWYTFLGAKNIPPYFNTFNHHSSSSSMWMTHEPTSLTALNTERLLAIKSPTRIQRILEKLLGTVTRTELIVLSRTCSLSFWMDDRWIN